MRDGQVATVNHSAVYCIGKGRFFQINIDSVLEWRRNEMFIGHYAVGLASKRLAPRASLGVLVAAPILLDLLWPIFVLTRWEHVAIQPGSNPFLRLEFIYYPFSHGLIAVIAWAILFASIYFGLSRYLEGAVVVWAAVISHWLLDYVVHRPDLPLYVGGRELGMGLWNHRWITIAAELVMFAVAILLYLRQTRAKDKIGTFAFWAFIAVLLAGYAGAAFGPAPPSVRKMAIVTLLSSLFIPWAWWFDSHRELREEETPKTKEPKAKAPKKEPPAKAVTYAGG